MLNVTEKATNILQDLIAGAEEPLTGLRIAVDAGGCTGLQYRLALVHDAIKGDQIVECGTIKIYVAAESADLIAGTTIDFVERVDGAGFSFDNPNAANKCSCGRSFAA